MAICARPSNSNKIFEKVKVLFNVVSTEYCWLFPTTDSLDVCVSKYTTYLVHVESSILHASESGLLSRLEVFTGVADWIDAYIPFLRTGCTAKRFSLIVSVLSDIILYYS